MSLTSLPTDITQLDDLSPKAAGSLIKHEDWNTLVASVQGIGTALQEYIAQANQRMTDIETMLNPLPGQVADLEAAVADLTEQVQPLMDRYVVTLRTQKQNYLMGELCEMIATVRDLQGNPVTSRPWIDFMTNWGQLRAAPGFQTDVSATGGSISVRTNSDGIARVLVKAAHTANLSEAQEAQVATAMETTLPSGMFFYQAIMSAPTPGSNSAKQAFQVMNSQYEQGQQNPVQQFIDEYHFFPDYQYHNPWTPSFSNWKHYRTVVMAMVKDDSDPLTPDGSKGAASIQVQFRDWIGPWIFDYVNDFDIFVPEIIDVLETQIGSGLFKQDLDIIHDLVEDNIGILGAVGRQKYYNGVIDAIDQVDVTDPPPYMQDLRNSVKYAVSVQQMQESPGVAVKGNQVSKTPGMTAMTGAAKNAAAAKDTAESTLNTYESLQANNQEMNDRIMALDNDLQITHQLSNNINNELASIGQNVLRINTLDQNSVQGQVNLITAQIGQINEALRRG
ncbi:MAG: hypothetical protein R3208_19920 [Ketobacteraceae bacterium]|nr:hypothetical protein [Ketobacteraceae bacterium]